VLTALAFWERTCPDNASTPCRRGEPRFETWLRLCEGFRVFAAHGCLGTVESVAHDRDDRPKSLVVRTGLFRRTQIEVEVNEVDAIVPETRRVLLRTSAVAT
jgi:hypothetical protein